MSEQVVDHSPEQSGAIRVKGSRRKAVLGVGLLLVLGGAGVGGALFVTARSQYEEAVANLQRAPVGCDTDLNFTGTGKFTFFIETKGRVGKLRGDCENTESEYSRPAGERLPIVALTLVDADGSEVDLDRATGASYDVGGFVGTATRSLTLSTPAKYTLSVESDDTDFAIAIGRDPQRDYDRQALIALVVFGSGLVVGLMLIVLGLRRQGAHIVMGPYAGAPDTLAPPHLGDTQFAPPTWMPVEQPNVWAPLDPEPTTALPPPSWQPPHTDDSDTGWSAPQQ